MTRMETGIWQLFMIFNLMCCVYGIVEPDLKNEKLMEHFGASTPKDLAAALFWSRNRGLLQAKLLNFPDLEKMLRKK